MIQWGFIGAAILGTGMLIKYFQKPQIVELSPPGAVIFNPAPSTGSDTYLGDITGVPGMFWNITTQIADIPSGFINTSAVENQPTNPNTPVWSSK
jgi:hypothetical protein